MFLHECNIPKNSTDEMAVHIPALVLPWIQNRVITRNDLLEHQWGGQWHIQFLLMEPEHLNVWWTVPPQYKLRITENRNRPGKISSGRSIISLSLATDVFKKFNDGNPLTSWDNPFYPVTTQMNTESFLMQLPFTSLAVLFLTLLLSLMIIILFLPSSFHSPACLSSF